MNQKQFKSKTIYYVSGKSTNSEWPDMPMEHIWCAFTNHISVIKEYYEVKPIIFILMEDSFHLICECNNKKIFKEGMSYFKQACEGTMTLIDYWDCLFSEDALVVKKITSWCNLLDLYKKINRIPVNSGYVFDCEDYPFSSRNCTLYEENKSLYEDFLVSDFEKLKIIEWLNNKIEHFDVPIH